MEMIEEMPTKIIDPLNKYITELQSHVDQDIDVKYVLITRTRTRYTLHNHFTLHFTIRCHITLH